jgi:hypothetical protein
MEGSKYGYFEILHILAPFGATEGNHEKVESL